MRSSIAITLALALSAPAALEGGQEAPPTREPREEAYTIAPTRSGDVELRLDLYAPLHAPIRGAVVLMHGGGFVIGARDIEENEAYGTALSERGYLAAAISYRLHGDSPVVHGWAADYSRKIRKYGHQRTHVQRRLEELIERYGPEITDAVAGAGQDLQAAVAWLREHASELGFEPDDVAVFGASAGAMTALVTAYALDEYGAENLPVAGVIDLRGLLLTPGVSGTVLEAGDPPLMILHGEADERVPLAEADAVFRRATEAGVHVQYLTAPGHGHELGGRELLDLEVGTGGTVLDRIDDFLAAAFTNGLRPGIHVRGRLSAAPGTGRLSAAPSTGGYLFAYRPHAGARAAFEEGYRRHLEWHRTKADSLVWYGWDIVAGPRMGMFVDGTFGTPFAALDARVDPPGDAADAAANFLPHAEPTARELVLLRPDLSTATPLEDMTPTRIVEVVSYRAGPRGAVRLEEAFKSLRRDDATPSLLPYTVYEVVAGNAPGFLLMIWRDGLGTFDAVERNPQRALRWVLADLDSGTDHAGRRYVNVTSELWRYRSDLTYLGPEEAR